MVQAPKKLDKRIEIRNSLCHKELRKLMGDSSYSLIFYPVISYKILCVYFEFFANFLLTIISIHPTTMFILQLCFSR
jgi:hypothetical protein